MRRQEILEGISQVVAALKQTDMVKVIESIARADARAASDKPINPLFLEAFKQYLFAAQAYNPAARRVAQVFGLAALEEPSFWSHPEGSGSFHKIYSAIHFALDFLPKLAELVTPEIDEGLLKASAVANGKIDSPVLTLILPEDAHRHSKPQRISEALMGITHLYEAVAVMGSVAENALIVLTCDSGSDKSFDLLGAAKVITGVKEIILSLWDRIVFYREAQVSQRLELITASLPILEELSHLQNSNAITPEQAELLRRKVLDGVGQFIASGATIPEMGDRSHVNPRQLMAAEPKLLTTGAKQPSKKDEPTRGRKKRQPSK